MSDNMLTMEDRRIAEIETIKIDQGPVIDELTKIPENYREYIKKWGIKPATKKEVLAHLENFNIWYTYEDARAYLGNATPTADNAMFGLGFTTEKHTNIMRKMLLGKLRRTMRGYVREFWCVYKEAEAYLENAHPHDKDIDVLLREWDKP